jgi:hypothetical protein
LRTADCDSLAAPMESGALQIMREPAPKPRIVLGSNNAP